MRVRIPPRALAPGRDRARRGSAQRASNAPRMLEVISFIPTLCVLGLVLFGIAGYEPTAPAGPVGRRRRDHGRPGRRDAVRLRRLAPAGRRRARSSRPRTPRTATARSAGDPPTRNAGVPVRARARPGPPARGDAGARGRAIASRSSRTSRAGCSSCWRRARGAKRAVEVGTAIGVSTLHLARGGAHVTSFEVDPERHEQATRYLTRDGRAEQVDLRLQDAAEGLAELEPGSFDLGFIDGPKAGYPSYLDQIVGLLRPGGLLIADNVLMGGGAATGEATNQWSAESIAAHPRVQRRPEGARRPARDRPPRR